MEARYYENYPPSGMVSVFDSFLARLYHINNIITTVHQVLLIKKFYPDLK